MKEDMDDKLSKLEENKYKRIKTNKLESLQWISKGFFHATFQVQLEGELVIYKRYIISFEEDDKTLLEILEEEKRREQIVKLNNQYFVSYLGLSIDWPYFGFLTKYYSKGSIYHLWIKDKQSSITMKQIIKISLDISKAIKALHQINLVVRIIATRNVFIEDIDGSISGKLDINFEPSSVHLKYGNQDAYVGPVSWIAPEAMETKKYTTQSDCFSFGVFLWELFARKDPFNDRTAIEVACPVIHKSLRLKIPSDIPKPIQSLIEKCFQENPKSRPTIDEIEKVLSQQLE